MPPDVAAGTARSGAASADHGFDSHAYAHAELDGAGRTRLVALRSSGPLVLRSTPSGLFLVGGGAGPVGGDRLRLDLTVGPGAAITVRSVAASLLHPGFADRASRLGIAVHVGEGATLHWLPEPTIALPGCRHATRTRIELQAGARLVWREELILGRGGEPPGNVASRLDLSLEQRPLLRQQLRIGDDASGYAGAAVLGGSAMTGTVTVVDPSWWQTPPAGGSLGARAGILKLPGPAAQVSALADDAPILRALLDAGLAELGVT